MGFKTTKVEQTFQLDLSVKVTLTDVAYWDGLNEPNQEHLEITKEELVEALTARLVGDQQRDELSFSQVDITYFGVSLDNCKTTKLQ